MSEQWENPEEQDGSHEFSDADDVRDFLVNVPVWFDALENRLSTDDLDALSLAARQLGRSLGDVLVDLRNVEPSQARAIKFETLGEALTYLTDAGIMSFSRVYRDSYGRFSVAVIDCSPPNSPHCLEQLEAIENEYFGSNREEDVEF